ncbi:MAG TPA: hypothetical protein VMF06_05135 [Candidatus Limnocylindria bacterium]|jgi:hypothetical protein|nr:hypothetical protein [Candidatus Limnocylindria bacterium]
MNLTYFYEDIETSDWDSVVWRAAKVGQQGLWLTYYVGSEEIDTTTTRVYYFSLPLGTATVASAKAGNPKLLPPPPEAGEAP